MGGQSYSQHYITIFSLVIDLTVFKLKLNFKQKFRSY